MPERFKYSHLFDGNPFDGKNPEEVFSLLHWGNTHKRITEIDAPEPLVMLGVMALLAMESGHQLHFNKGEAFLAVGNKTNQLYIIPRVRNKPIEKVPDFSRALKRIGRVKATHYLSTKGGSKEHYYYHDHEPPYPMLYLHNSSGCGYIRAANYKGKPSYAVGREGIVG